MLFLQLKPTLAKNLGEQGRQSKAFKGSSKHATPPRRKPSFMLCKKMFRQHNHFLADAGITYLAVNEP